MSTSSSASSSPSASAQKITIKPTPVHTRTTSTEQLTTRFEFDQPTFLLASISSAISFVYLILSMLDLGRLTYYIGPPTAFCSLVFYLTVYILGRVHRRARRRNPKAPKTCPPAFSLTSIVLAFCMFTCWIAPLLLTIWAGINRGEFLPGMRNLFVKGNLGLLVVEVILIGVNLVFIGFVILFFYGGRRQYLRKQSQASQLLGGKTHRNNREKGSVTSMGSQV